MYMDKVVHSQNTVVRTDRGLSIAGTRITLYQVMDYIKASWPPKLIQHWLNLNDQQIADVMDYIGTHREEVENEYQTVLKQAEEDRQYWETRNREHFATRPRQSPKPGQEAIRAKLQAWKAKQGLT
jgi:hypothetical protein